MKPQQREEAPEGRTLLVVDDSPFDREILVSVLEGQGYTVHTAHNADAAWQQAKVIQPDLILLDINMPGMDGYSVCWQLKSSEATQDIPVIFISAADDGAAKVQAFKSGGVDYITKPFYSEEVLARVSTHLAFHELQRRLEHRVRERSANLAAANQRLEKEIAERRQAEERFRTMLEAVPDAIVIVDDGGRIVLVNSQSEKLFGYGRDELSGQPLDILIPERFRALHRDQVGTWVAAPRPRFAGRHQDLFGLRRDGSEFPAEISLNPLVTDDNYLVISAIRDVSARKEAERELLESRQLLRNLTTHREAVREEERKTIARELHDELGSSLTALKVDISLMKMEIGDNIGALKRLGNMRELVEHTIGIVRQVSTSLRPSVLNLGLVPALEWLVQDFRRRTELACSLRADAEVTMDDAQATAVFRIVQESLTNVLRHADARRVDVVLNCCERGMELTVRDDGRGFDPSSVGGESFGLLNIRERATILGGEATVESEPGEGTRVSIRIPLSA
ncbi:MAG TPA: response regulator [Rhodocyclaceae bacterium]|nr:response regulator [Rhodocyclaceae bacterium]